MGKGESGKLAISGEAVGVLGRRPLDGSRQAFVEEVLGPLPPIRLADGRFADGICRLVGAAALVLGRTVLVTPAAAQWIAAWDDAGRRLLLHEAVHVRQYHRHGMVAFLGRYFAAYLRGRLAGLGHHAAYRAIPFEREAFDLEQPPGSV